MAGHDVGQGGLEGGSQAWALAVGQVEGHADVIAQVEDLAGANLAHLACGGARQTGDPGQGGEGKACDVGLEVA